jgi:hypothetical protein
MVEQERYGVMNSVRFDCMVVVEDNNEGRSNPGEVIDEGYQNRFRHRGLRRVEQRFGA